MTDGEGSAFKNDLEVLGEMAKMVAITAQYLQATTYKGGLTISVMSCAVFYFQQINEVREVIEATYKELQEVVGKSMADAVKGDDANEGVEK